MNNTVSDYIDKGLKLVPIPPRSKAPTHTEWNHSKNMLQTADQLPDQYGVGLAHALSGTMALDIDDWARAEVELDKYDISLDELYAAPDAVIIDSGRHGHGKLLYKMPMGIPLPSTKLIDVREDGVKYNYLDFRCASSNGLTVQDVLPPSIHPDTHEPYRWAGGGDPLNPPEIPPKLIKLWRDLLDDKTAVKPIKVNGTGKVDWPEVWLAINSISADIDYNDWIKVGMAMFDAGRTSGDFEKAFNVWDKWSKGSKDKYPGEKGLLVHWKSFKPDGDITLATMYDLAINAGWKRPPPDISGIFSKVEPPKKEIPKGDLGKAPIDLQDLLCPPPPDIDVSAFPDALRLRAEEVSISAGCDPLIPLFAGLGAVSAAVDGHTRLELKRGFQVPPMIWAMTIGDPANKKTPGASPMLAPLDAIEKSDGKNFAQKMLMWEGKKAAHDSAKKSFLEFFQDPSSNLDNDVMPTVPEIDEPPAPMRLTVTDITSQMLIHVVSKRPRGVLCFLDEMNGWLKKMTSTNSGDDRSTWVTSYESKMYNYDRVGHGSIKVPNFAVSIYGHIQPSALRRHFANLSEDGLFQRFMLVPLRVDYTNIGSGDAQHFQHIQAWEQTLRNLHSLPAMTYKLSPDAEALFVEFQRWADIVKKEESIIQSDEVFRGAVGKIEGTCGRFALLWHMLKDPYNLEVSVETMQDVIDFMKHYHFNALRYTIDHICGQGHKKLEYWLVDHVVQHSDKQTISLRELKRSAKRLFEGVNSFEQGNLVKDAMVSLEMSNWVAMIEDTRQSTIWGINPKLRDEYQHHRQKVIKAKQSVLDRNYKLAVKYSRGAKKINHQYAYGYEGEKKQ